MSTLQRERVLKRSRWPSYPLQSSPLFRLQSKRKLAELLCVELGALRVLQASPDNYIRFAIHHPEKKPREIQQPKSRLSAVHGRIFDLMRRIEPPSYLKSGVRGQSQITNAQEHLNDHQGFKFDIRSFFPSVKRSHVFACFYRTFQMSPDVADILADICTADAHVPTGSILSGELAFFANYPMFEEMNRLAEHAGATFTVYVDDITVSGLGASRLLCHRMRSVASKHGYKTHKLKYFRPGRPREVTGVVIRDAQMRIPNRRHLKLYRRFQEMDASVGTTDFPRVGRSVLGMMEAANQIAPCFRARRKSLRAEVKCAEGATN